MNIWHLFPRNVSHHHAGMIRFFCDYAEQMNTSRGDHHFVLAGPPAPSHLTEASPIESNTPNVHIETTPLTVCALLYFFRRLAPVDLLVIHYAKARVWPALVLNPFIWRRTVWVMWGADLHEFDSKPRSDNTLRSRIRRRLITSLRRFLVPRLGAIAALMPRDLEHLAQECGPIRNGVSAFYASSTPPIPPSRVEPQSAVDGRIRVILGNSASLTNNHLEVIEWLSRFRTESIEVICPLSYGDSSYASVVATVGKRQMGEKFLPIMEFLGREEYVKCLWSADILIFNHHRQEGLFVLYQMLSQGRKCFLRSGCSSYQFLEDVGIPVKATETLSALSFSEFIEPNSPDVVASIQQKWHDLRSVDSSVQSWRDLFARFKTA